MVEFIEYAGLWAPGIIAILGGAVLGVSFSRSEQGDEEKTGLKLILGKKEERVENEERKAA